MPLSQSAVFYSTPTKNGMILIYIVENCFCTDRVKKKLDFEMAEKIPDTAVLSFWSIIGIAIPLSSHAK